MAALIQGLDTVLDGTRNTGLGELRELLADILGGPDVQGRLIEQRRLSRERVFRLRFELGDEATADSGGESSGAGSSGGWSSGGGRCVRSLIVKRLPVERSLRERLAITSWLPRAGFAGRTATLVGVAAERSAGQVWHVYADLGDCTLRQVAGDAAKVRAAVELIAGVHTRFVGNPLLAECRLVGVDLGTGFFAASVTDAVRGLDAMTRLESLHEERRGLVERLLQRLATLAGERFDRTNEVADLGWPETLQHGDLWTTNVLVLPGGDGPDDTGPAIDVRLIDWDHSGVGPALYDLTTFLRQFPRDVRPAIVDTSRECVARAHWAWPGNAAFNRMAETAELARYSNSVIWRTIVALGGDPAATPEWVFEDLAEIEVWFQELTPLLPEQGDQEPSPLWPTARADDGDPQLLLPATRADDGDPQPLLPASRAGDWDLQPPLPASDAGNQELRAS